MMMMMIIVIIITVNINNGFIVEFINYILIQLQVHINYYNS